MSEASPKLGILLPTRGILLQGQSPPDVGLVLALAEQAEEAGCDSVWVGDSLLAKPRLEPITTLAAIATRTRQVQLGTAVLLAAMRHPVLLAHAIATLDVLSGGRAVLAAGVGGVFTQDQRQEWHAAGVQPKERAGRLEEMSQIVKKLWTEDNVTFQGRYFTLKNATLEPKPMQRGGVPLLLACHLQTGSPAQYRRAARYADGFISITDSPAEFAQVAERVAACAREQGRDPASLDAVYYMTVNIHQDEARAREEAKGFIMQYYGLDFWKEQWGPYGRPETVAQRIGEFAQAGARHIIVRFASFDQLGQFRAFRSEVLPVLRKC